uniref:Uncharacterized protein n=1 Tax=Caenorhabditis japonica TaxID=281687 RepID=A0A2Q4SH52_CAEJA
MARIRGRSVGWLAPWSGLLAARLAVRRHGAVSWRLGWLFGVMEQIGGGSVGWLAPWSGLLAARLAVRRHGADWWRIGWLVGAVERVVGGVAQLVWRREAACWWYWRLVWTIL